MHSDFKYCTDTHKNTKTEPQIKNTYIYKLHTITQAVVTLENYWSLRLLWRFLSLI
jgi:hypothetical protein